MCHKSCGITCIVDMQTKPRVSSPVSLHRQSGNMIVMALFMIIVIGLLSAALVKLVSSSSNSVIHQVYGLRAKQAAQAGIQSLLQTSFNVDGSINACNTTINSPSNLSNVPGLNGCAYQASCTSTNITFASQDHVSYKFTSTGSCVVGSYVVSRTVSVDALEEANP